MEGPSGAADGWGFDRCHQATRCHRRFQIRDCGSEPSCPGGPIDPLRRISQVPADPLSIGPGRSGRRSLAHAALGCRTSRDVRGQLHTRP
jgi:hypothetical protein